ncbi:hypothetical protein B0H66DRAFT_48227 [Apodospora peruviana]|uniref:Secreted protein n=1 Tax=Apodospora peruviana TaxID=516989 RepID=A0AAE0IS54_9PEZI|nr:hypothetical protein B0H66DRAFT_48227 [Apodospora peruviana]
MRLLLMALTFPALSHPSLSLTIAFAAKGCWMGGPSIQRGITIIVTSHITLACTELAGHDFHFHSHSRHIFLRHPSVYGGTNVACLPYPYSTT